MGGLTADVADQTRKTAAQSRTHFVGHRQLPWIHLHRSWFPPALRPRDALPES
jgi:hypothetical protein